MMIITILLSSCISLSAQHHEIKLIAHKDSRGYYTQLFFKQLRTLFDIKTYIETGTGYGHSAFAAAHVFSAVHTIELHAGLYYYSAARLAPCKNVHLYLGASESLLPKLLHEHQGAPLLINLDAHYCGGGSALGETITPILQEMRAIATLAPQAIVVIDDIRLFQRHAQLQRFIQDHPEDSNITGYPEFNEFYSFVRTLHPDYEQVSVGDALLVYRKDLHPTISPSPVLRALTTSRLCPITEQDQEKLAKLWQAEHVLLSPESQKEVTQLAYVFHGSTYPPIFATYYYLWNGISALGAKQYGIARHFFERAVEYGMSPERIAPYKEMVLNA